VKLPVSSHWTLVREEEKLPTIMKVAALISGVALALSGT
jgi:hypothetical protein